jgi:CheY-like chemotaxis protein
MAKSDPILLAEDDEDFVELIRRAFQRASVSNRLVVARNGKEAIEYLEREASFPDRAAHPLPGLMMLDLHMPLLDGFDVLAWLRARPGLQEVPAVLLASFCGEEEMRKARQLGAADCRRKPHPDELQSLVEELHWRWFLDETSAAV